MEKEGTVAYRVGAGKEKTDWVPGKSSTSSADPLPHPFGRPQAGYEAAFERAVDGLLERLALLRWERPRAERLLARLREVDLIHRRLLLVNDPATSSWSFAAVLLEEARALTFSDTAESLELAELSRRVAADLEPGACGPLLLAELRARTWACVGHVSRVIGHLGRAAEAFREARRHLAAGTGDPLVEGMVFDQEASFEATRQHFRKAWELLEAAAIRFRRVRDYHLEGRSWLKQGVAGHLLGRGGEAAERLEEGVSQIDPGRDPYAGAMGYALLAWQHRRRFPCLRAQARALAAWRSAFHCLAFSSAEGARPVVERVGELLDPPWAEAGEELPLRCWPHRL